MNPLAPFERALRFLTNIPNVLFSAVGVLFLVGGLVLAAVISSKELAVAVAVGGTFIGTALLSLLFPKRFTHGNKRNWNTQPRTLAPRSNVWRSSGGIWKQRGG